MTIGLFGFAAGMAFGYLVGHGPAYRRGHRHGEIIGRVAAATEQLRRIAGATRIETPDPDTDPGR